MRIRLGYACISETLHVTSSSSYTYQNFRKEQNYQKLDEVIQSNFFALEQLLLYNMKNGIHFYRMDSNLIPLATKEEVEFDYIAPYQNWYQRLGDLVSSANMRVDFHPSEYCVLNSIHPEVVERSKLILEYHYRLLSAFGIVDKVLVLHVGSNAFGKKQSIARFCANFHRLEKKLQDAIVIENDDKVFTIDDCLEIHEQLKIPVVFDYHHHFCNPGQLAMEEFLPRVLASWKDKTPKMHFSSPKSKLKKERRSHHDYIDSSKFLSFLLEVKKYSCDIDFMIEAKKKDEALFRLVREIKYQTNFFFEDETTFYL